MRNCTSSTVGRPESGQWLCLFDARAVGLFWLAAALIWGIAAPCAAQTNVPPDFQGFRPGDTVRVKAKKPLIDFARARFQSETSSNIVVICKGDRYCLDKAAVTLSVPEAVALRETLSATNATQRAIKALALQSAQGASDAENAQTSPLSEMQAVEAKILGNYKGDKGYDAATKYYQETMQGVLSGKISLDDLVTQAEEALKKVDEYGPERAKDPQFEEQIRQLREFVQRAHSGERIVTGPEAIP